MTDKIDAIFEFASNDLTIQELADKVGASYQFTWRVIRANSLPAKPHGADRKARLDAAYEPGKLGKVLAYEAGVSQSTAERYKAKRSRKLRDEALRVPALEAEIQKWKTLALFLLVSNPKSLESHESRLWARPLERRKRTLASRSLEPRGSSLKNSLRFLE